ncbi:MAG: hypothetical protein WCO53_14650 [Deltaproteobacteria bacterium]
MPARECYKHNLENPKQRGEGAHSYVMRMANLARLAEISSQQAFDDLRGVLDRRVRDNEITTAIKKANNGTFTPRPRPAPVVRDGKAALQKIINQAKIKNEVDLWESSPIRLWEEPKDDASLLLKILFKPDELVFIGDRHDADTIKTAAEWITLFSNGGMTAPFIIINSLSGIPAPAKSGDKTTLRGDANVTAFKYCMAEFDTISKEDQIKFWSAVKLPIVALIDSGGKSIHAWINVQKMAKVETAEQWQSEIKNRLYDKILIPLGVDAACSNPSRLSRLPGHYRTEKQAWQKLLWLSPEGRSIC